jgi:acyl-CoA thioester hydrolase
VHTLELTAQPSDIDDLGHVSNVVYVRWILEVALAHSVALGWDSAAYRQLGATFVVRRHEIDYLQSVLEGDHVILSTWVESWKQVSTVRRTSIRRARDGVEVCRSATTWAFIDLATGRPRRITDELRRAFAPQLMAAAAP